MDTKFQTSFIPKKPLVPTGRIETHRSINFFFLIGFVIFLITLAALAYVLIQKQFLKNNIAENEKTLATTKRAFDPSLIQMLTKLDTRFESGKTLLGNHIAVSSFFAVLQTLTLKSVRFSDFKYSLVGNDKVTITMKGEGESFSSIALQSDVFGKTKLLKDPIISDLTLETNGNVGFNFSASVDSSVILYKNSASYVPATTTAQSFTASSTSANSLTSSTTPSTPKK